MLRVVVAAVAVLLSRFLLAVVIGWLANRPGARWVHVAAVANTAILASVGLTIAEFTRSGLSIYSVLFALLMLYLAYSGARLGVVGFSAIKAAEQVSGRRGPMGDGIAARPVPPKAPTASPRSDNPEAPAFANKLIVEENQRLVTRMSVAAAERYKLRVSELDVAIEAHRRFAVSQRIVESNLSQDDDLTWSCCASVYASMRYAEQFGKMEISWLVWNSIRRAVVNRMVADGSEFEGCEEDAQAQLEEIDEAVERAMAEPPPYKIRPLVETLSQVFRTNDAKSVEALSAIVLINADTAHKTILPELLETFS
jgi:hypothetical protein